MQAAIDIRDVTKSFGGRIAVDRLTLGIPAGAIFALLGDNGAGKTTTIRMLTGLLPPDAGEASILGKDCWKSAVALREQIGYVPERPHFYNWMTVADVGWFTAGFHKPGFLERYRERANVFKLPWTSRLDQLSKGGYAKVALALALAGNPEVLILDEPTSGLDLFVRREFLASMVTLASEGKTILISSHQIAEVERVASHVAFLAGGRLLWSGTLDELRQRIIRVKLRYESRPPEPATLGTVLQRNGTGKLFQAIIQDPNREAVAALRQAEGITEVEECTLGLEEVYAALLGRAEVDM